MSTALVPLALLMAAVTYPARAIPLLVPGINRLPALVLAFLRLVGPAVLASLASVSLVLARDPAGGTRLIIGPQWIAVALCVVMVAWRRNLLLGLILAAGVMALLRALGWAEV